ncbi:hypothetical protein ACSFA8_23935 [Variovorax sp. RT4R15]
MASLERSTDVPLTWFCVWEADRILPLDPYERNALRALVNGCPGTQAAHLMLPTSADDPFYPDRAGSPSLVVQLDFAYSPVLEQHLRPGGYLAPLADPEFLPSLARAQATQQGMLARHYPVAEPARYSAHAECVSYWVEYAGPAADPNRWHEAYMRYHPLLLSQFPGIRAIEIYTPASLVCGLPLPERPCLQRNKTVFDSAQAMSHAMQSPVRDLLRQDFHRLPAFEGATLHFPFETLTCRPSAPDLP